MSIIVADVFHQNYGTEDGIPPHWAVKYYQGNSNWPLYFNCDSYKEAESWISKNADNAESWI